MKLKERIKNLFAVVEQLPFRLSALEKLMATLTQKPSIDDELRTISYQVLGIFNGYEHLHKFSPLQAMLDSPERTAKLAIIAGAYPLIHEEISHLIRSQVDLTMAEGDDRDKINNGRAYIIALEKVNEHISLFAGQYKDIQLQGMYKNDKSYRIATHEQILKSLGITNVSEGTEKEPDA